MPVMKMYRIEVSGLVEEGGAPFGGRFNATIAEVVDGYKEVIRRLKRQDASASSQEKSA